MSDEKRRDSAGRVASALALPDWSLRRKLALALTIPMLLAATFGGLRVRSELSEADNYSATAKQVTVLRPAADYLAAAEHAIITSRQKPRLDDPDRAKAIADVDAAGKRLQAAGGSADLTDTQQKRLDSVLKLSAQLRDGDAYISVGQAVSQVRQLQRGVTELIDSIIVEQIEPEPKLAALQQSLDGRVSLAMQQFQVATNVQTQINLVDLSAELGVEQVIIDRLGSYLGTEDRRVLALNQQNAAHFGAVRGSGDDLSAADLAAALGGADAFEPYDGLSTDLLNDIDSNLSNAANDARALAIANAVITAALLLAAIFLALFVSRLLLGPIRRVREGALEVANERLPETVAAIRAGKEPGDITPIPVTTHEEMGQLARAVDDLHRQAVHLASGEAKLRTQVGEMFSTLSRRNTTLINQQLSLIERLEKDEEDPNRLESLFRLDHLASRMRRTADSLMVLADAPVQTSDADALSLGDVFQAAMAGVQEYQRVQIESSPTDQVSGAASSDVVHLMTELVDNALAFSPPTAPVKISTKQAGDSTIVEISDGGLGIAPDVLASLNEDLRSGGEVTPETARRMGLLVVSRLAKRQGMTVSLARNARGGTTATVLVPPALLRGRTPEVQAKQRPGLTAVPSAPKADAPVVVSESLTNERTPAGPAQPAAAAASPAAAADTDQDVDSIAAAINAVTRLPQRQPGASRTGGVMPGAPTGSTGGSLFQRLKAAENGKASARPESPAVAEAPVAAAPVEAETADVEAPQVTEAETPEVTEVEAPATEVTAQAEPERQLEPEPAREPELGLATAEPEALQEAAEEAAGAALETVVAANGVEPAETPAMETWIAPPSAEGNFVAPPAAVTVYDSLDSRTPMPEPTEDETPIFRTLRSNWFTTGDTDGTWTTTEIEAGWQAAENADAPALQLSESGLPMRRPGKQLVPGGVTPAQTNVARDPEAIRARLAAHAAGVSRGRTASHDEPVPAPSNEEGPA